MTLEGIVGKGIQGLKWYGGSIRDNYKEFVPALVCSTAAASLAQAAVDMMENPHEVLMQSAGYFAALASGYVVFLGLSYKNKPENYPNGFISKEMGNTFATMASADYVADLVSYTPVFITVNHLMLNNGHSGLVSGLCAAGAASTTYFFTVCGLYDRCQAAAKHINKGVRKVIPSRNREYLSC